MESAKTLILNNKQNQNFKAVLNLKTTEPSIIKFFNLNFTNKNFALGIKRKDGVLKVPLEVKNNCCSFNLPKNINLEEKIFCAVVDVTNAFCPEIILSGSINELSHNVTIENAFVQTKPEKIENLYENDEDEQIQNLIDKNLEEDLNSVYYDTCSKCKYRQAFYSEGEGCFCSDNKFLEEKKVLINNENNNNDETIIKNEPEKQPLQDEIIEDEKEPLNSDNSAFYDQIKPQIDALFEKYPKEELLERIIANSKWVKVEYDNQKEYYVLGLVFDENMEKVEYISYGIPSQNNNVPPDELQDYAQWLPIDNLEDKKGYWIVYQEAITGETIKVDFV